MSNSQQNPNQVDSTTALRIRKQPQVGDVLDGIYKLEQPLGRGGVGVVYRAFHLHLLRPCAIKFMHPQLVSNPELRTRFRREAQSAFQLGHPHIVAITDFRDDPNAWPYLVMELVLGETLRDRLDRGALEPQLALRMMVELCDALAAAHRRGVIHRDLKPENLFLSKVDSPAPDEFDVTMKVLDFGLSKLLDGVEITGSGRLLGSPSYMSPEQARGDSHLVDARSDIFAVGALIYECLTGEKMFSAEKLEQKRQAIMAARLPPLRFAERGLPMIDKIIARACSQKSEDRYQSAAALQGALEEAEKVLAGKVAATSPAAIPIPVVIPIFTAPGHPPGSGEGSSTAASVSGGEIISARGPNKRRRTGVWMFAATASLVAVGLGGFAGYSAWRTFAAPTLVATVSPDRTVVPPTVMPDKPLVTAIKPTLVAAAQPPVAPTVTPPAQPTEGIVPASAPVPDTAKPRAGATLPLRMADDIVAEAAAPSVTPTPTPAAPVPSGPGRRKGGRGPMRPIAVAGPRPAAPVARPGASLMEIVQGANDILRRSSPAVKRCYPESVTPPSKISVDITVQADGRVSEANIDGAEDGAGCVLRVLRGLRFAPPTDGDSYATRFDFVNLRR